MKRPNFSLLASIVIATVVGACQASQGTLAAPGGLTISARTALTGDDSDRGVATAMIVRNVGSAAETISYFGGCPAETPVNLRAYYGASDRVVWDWGAYLPDAICLGSQQQALLLPGDSIEFSSVVRVKAILGDSLPAGLYTFSVTGAHLAPPIAMNVISGTLELQR